MIRAAAKNHDACRRRRRSRRLRHACSPRWRRTAARRRSNCGASSRRRPLRAPAAYDAAIAQLVRGSRSRTQAPARRAFGGTLAPSRCATARTRTSRRPSTLPTTMRAGVATARQLQGKELSYNNINDTDAAFELVCEFDPQGRRRSRSSSTPIRAASPIGATLQEAYQQGARLRSA